MAVEYGTIGIRLMGEWKPDQQYDLLNQVSHDGSSYLVHTKPPVGTLPTNLDYWQASALGTSKATANSVGTVKPDGTTTEVSADGSLSVKTAAQSTLGLVKGSNGIKVDTDGSIDVNTLFTQATELANIIAEEAISSVLGKISKAIAVTIGLNENALLKNMLTNMDANDQNKIPTAAFVHSLYQRIGMGTELTAGSNLTAVVEALNTNLNNKIKTTTYSCTSDSFGLVDFSGASFTNLHGILSVNVIANSRPALYSSGDSNATAKYGYAIYNSGASSYERATSASCQLTITYW